METVIKTWESEAEFAPELCKKLDKINAKHGVRYPHLAYNYIEDRNQFNDTELRLLHDDGLITDFAYAYAKLHP